MRKKYYLLISLFLFNVIFAFGQKDSIIHLNKRSIEDKRVWLSLGISVQKQAVGEIGIMYGKIQIGREGLIIGSGYKLASEFNFNPKSFFIAPKLSWEAGAFFGFRISIIDYTNFNYHDFKLTPELGFAAYVLNVHLGYNIPINRSRIEDIGNFRFSLTFAL
jgi:hypothetical protein